MIVEIVISLLFICFFAWHLTGLSLKLRIVLWGAFWFHLGIVGYAHNWAIQQDSTGIVFDESIDAQKYFYNAEVLSKDSFFTIAPNDIAAVSGSTWHFAYYYLNTACMKLSRDPMLLMRLVKVYFFFFVVVVAARHWVERYNVRASLGGVLYLTFGWWEILYYNFRNLRDGLIVSLCLLIYILCDGLILSAARGKKKGGEMGGESSPGFPVRGGRKTGFWVQALVMRYGVLLICLALLVFSRIYLALILVAGFAVQIVINSVMPVGRKAAFLSVIALVTMAPFWYKFQDVVRYGSLLFEERVVSRSLFEGCIGCFQALLSPIPWQYSEKFLIPSQFMYLVMLAFSLLSLMVFIRPKPWGQLFIVVMLTLFLGFMMESSYARKRMPLVPIFASWMVAGVSRLKITPSHQKVSAFVPPMS